MRPFTLALLGSLALVAAACGGDSGPDPTPSPSASPGASASAAPSPTPAQSEVPEGEPAVSYNINDGEILFHGIARDPGDLVTSGSGIASGDFNGDGAVDLLVGAPFADGPDNARESAGEAYVLYGPVISSEADLTGAAGLIIYGALSEDLLGTTVGSGDINGDGIDDIVIGAVASHGLQNVRTDLGEAYVIYGSAELPSEIDIALVDQDVTVRAAEGFSRLGASMDVADVNGDGFDDLLVGAPFAGRGEGARPGSTRTTEGEAYLVLGRAGLRGEVDVAEAAQDLRFKGLRLRDNFGERVAFGDVNGDGALDVVITAPLAELADGSREDAGAAFVYFGPLTAEDVLFAGDADVIVYGAQAGDNLGKALTLGDITGDGIADLLLGAPGADGPADARNAAGELQIVFGGAGLPPEIDLGAGAPGSAVVYGRAEGDGYPAAAALWPQGEAVYLVVSAHLARGPEGGRDAGRVYVVATAEIAEALDLRTDLAAVTLIYGDEESELGQFLGVVDIDGDGAQELAVSAPGAEDLAETGGVYVIGPR
jgi:hypothetical protein